MRVKSRLSVSLFSMIVTIAVLSVIWLFVFNYLYLILTMKLQVDLHCPYNFGRRFDFGSNARIFCGSTYKDLEGIDARFLGHRSYTDIGFLCGLSAMYAA